MIVRGPFNELLRPGLRPDFRDGYMEYPEEYSGFLKTGNMTEAEIRAVTMSGLPRQVKRGEVEPFTLIDPKISDKVTYTDDEYGLGFSISKKMMEDDLYKKANQSAKWLGRSVRLTQEYLAADLLDDAFSGSTFTGLNSAALCSTAHTLLNSASTWSNSIAGNPQLGVTGLQAAFELGENTVDQQGDPIPVRIDSLVINIADEWMALQLTQNEQEPYTADRNINTTRRKRRLNYQVNHYKDQSGNDWFAQEKKATDSHFMFRIRPQFPDWFDDNTQSAYFAARQRILVYFYDQRGWIGSNAA
jgi:hypothetical protein